MGHEIMHVVDHCTCMCHSLYHTSTMYNSKLASSNENENNISHILPFRVTASWLKNDTEPDYTEYDMTRKRRNEMKTAFAMQQHAVQLTILLHGRTEPNWRTTIYTLTIENL